MLEANQHCQRCLKAPKVLLRSWRPYEPEELPFKLFSFVPIKACDNPLVLLPNLMYDISVSTVNGLGGL